MPKLPTPELLERWAAMHAEGWPIKNIAEKTGFSPDTVSKYLKETGAKEEKAAEGVVGGAVDEFEAFKAKKRLDELKDSLNAWVDSEILKLNFEGAEDSKGNLEWIRDQADKVKSEDELHKLSALAAAAIDEAQPMIRKHRGEIERKKAEEDTERVESAKAWRQTLRQASYSTISAAADRIGLQISEHFKTAIVVGSHEEASWYVRAIQLWAWAGGDPHSFLRFLQPDPYFIQLIHAIYGQQRIQT